MSEAGKPQVCIVMGSTSDLPTMEAAIDMLKEFEIPYTVRVLSAHRTPNETLKLAEEAKAAILDQSVQRGWAGLFDLKEPLPEKAPVIHHEEMPKPLTADEARTRSLEDLFG